jgi:hypothetical protein
MRAVGAVQTTHTVVAPDQSVRVAAESTVVTALAGVAGNTPRISRTLTQLPHEITEPRLEVSRAELLSIITHGIFPKARHVSYDASQQLRDGLWGLHPLLRVDASAAKRQAT